MKRFVKILLITLGVLIVAAIVGVWLLNRWVRSPEMHAHVERELSKALRVPLKFKSLTISPWGGITAAGIRVPDQNGNFFEATNFTAKHRLGALLGGRLVFEEITVDGPKFVLTQRSDGSWKAPPLPADLQAELNAKKKPKADKPKPAAPATPKPAATPKPKRGPDVVIEKLSITGGAAEMFDKDGRPFATLSDLKVKLTSATEEKIEGSVTVGHAVLYGEIAARDLRAVVSYSEKGVILPWIYAVIGGGKLEGSFATMPTREKEFGVPWSGKIALTNVDVLRAASEAGAKPPNLTGTLSGSAEFRGVESHRKLLQGKGSVKLANGTFQELEMIQQLGEFLSLEEVANFGIQEAVLDFQIAADRLSVQPLTISADPLVISATGGSKLDGKMDLDAKLAVSEGFLASRSKIASQFGPADALKRRTLDFDVTGTWTKPKSNLLEKLTGSKDKREQRIIVGESVLRKAIEEKANENKRADDAGKKP